MFRKGLFFLLLLAASIDLSRTQDQRLFRNLFREAESILLYLDREDEALELFLKLDSMDPGNAHIRYKIGLCYLHIPGAKEKAIPFLLQASESISEDFVSTYKEKNAPPDAFFYLALAYHVNNDLDLAIDAYNLFNEHADITSYYNVDYVREQINGCLLAKEMITRPVSIQENVLDDRINRGDFVINPAVSGNGRSMVYTIKREEGYQIYYATRGEEGWNIPRDITEEINSMGDGMSSSLSQDGETLFVYRDYGGLGDLFVSYLENGNWTELEPLNRNINTKYWESNCSLSPDGNTLFFSSNRKGGYGRLDIYRSDKTSEGEWGPPKNLGPVINSPLMEDHPQLTSDGNTLYFSSQGHNSLGGFDYFFSEKGKGRSWSFPVNMGYPISTTDDDLFMAPVGSGDTLFYSHYQDVSPVKKSIFQLIRCSEEPPTLITLHGTTRLQDSKIYDEPAVKVSVVDTLSGDTIKTVLPEPETGKYQVEVPPGSYTLVFQSEGYEPQEHALMVGKSFAAQDIALSTRLVPKPIVSGKYIAMENVYFNFDDYSIQDSEKMKLEKMAAIMFEYPQVKYELTGHTDTVGTQAYNIQLSKRRANAVAQYFFNKGIDNERLLTRGLGEILAIPKDQQQLAADLSDPRYFRRVEIKILKSDSLAEIREEMALPQYLLPKNSLNYTVIVLKVKEPLPDGFFDQYDMEELHYIREQKSTDGFIYTLGSFPQKQKAVKLLGELQELGFKDAEVVDQHELSDRVVEEEPDNGFFKMPEKISEIPYYTIQIFALKKPPHPSAFRGRKDVLAFECRDGFIRYCIGKYQGYSNAIKALPIIQNEWYKDAFIQEYSRLEKGLPPRMEE